MSILKIVPDPYTNRDALYVLIHCYIFPKARLIGGGAVDTSCAGEQMYLVKKLWCKENGRQLMHFILAYDQKESAHIANARSLLPDAYYVCEYFENEFQIVFGIHKKRDDTWHIHFVVNSVSYLTGKRLPKKNTNYTDLACHIEAGSLYTNFAKICFY